MAGIVWSYCHCAFTGPTKSNGCISIVCHSIPYEMRMRHTVLGIAIPQLRPDSRISHQEYKLSDCINRAWGKRPAKSHENLVQGRLCGLEQQRKPLFHIGLQLFEPCRIEAL